MDPERWSLLETILGTEILARVCGPFDDPRSGDRLAYLTDVVARVQRRLDAPGVREWFVAPTSALDGVAPADVLKGTWVPEEEGPTRLRDALPPLRRPT